MSSRSQVCYLEMRYQTWVQPELWIPPSLPTATAFKLRLSVLSCEFWRHVDHICQPQNLYRTVVCQSPTYPVQHFLSDICYWDTELNNGKGRKLSNSHHYLEGSLLKHELWYFLASSSPEIRLWASLEFPCTWTLPWTVVGTRWNQEGVIWCWKLLAVVKNGWKHGVVSCKK